MKINTNIALLDYENSPVLNEEKQPVFLRPLIAVALNNIDPSKVDSIKKGNLFGISVRLFADDEIELSVEEAALLKEFCGLSCTPLVYGRICELLEAQDK